MSWRDLWVFLSKAPRGSAFFQARNPETPSDGELLEAVVLLLTQSQLLLGNQSEIPLSRLPKQFADLLEKKAQQPTFYTEEQILREMAAFDRAIGRRSDASG